MNASGRTGLIVVAVGFALAAPVALTAYLTRDSSGTTPAATTSAATYGDGRVAEAHDLRLTNIRLPPAANTPGAVSVEILDQAGRPVTSMVRAQTKLVQLYVVRPDMTTFLHLYPRLANGTWSASATLPAAGAYRVIAEFTVDAGDHNDHVILGGEAVLPGTARSTPPLRPADDDVTIALEGAHEAVESGTVRLHVADRSGRPVNLGTHLGMSAHVTGFHGLTGSLVHLQPSGKPKQKPAGTVVTLRSNLRLTGPYVFFVQVRVRGELHTLRAVANVQ